MNREEMWIFKPAVLKDVARSLSMPVLSDFWYRSIVISFSELSYGSRLAHCLPAPALIWGAVRTVRESHSTL